MVSKEKLQKITGAIEGASDDPDEKLIWDAALDLVELVVESTPTKIDDFLVKPLLRILRRRFDIPNS